MWYIYFKMWLVTKSYILNESIVINQRSINKLLLPIYHNQLEDCNRMWKIYTILIESHT